MQTFGSWMTTAWQSPIADTRPGGGLMLRGAMLSIDVPLADAVLIRPVPPASIRPYLLDQDREALLRFLAYSLALPETDGATLAALEAGRRQANRWATELPPQGELQQTLRNAGLDERRANLLAWEAHHGATPLGDWLMPTELLKLAAVSPAAPAFKGAPPSEGCHCLQVLDIASPEDLRGRESSPLLAVLPNLTMRLAEHLRALELPQSLMAALLPVAVQDWMDQVSQIMTDDWESSAGWLRRLTRERVEDYLLTLLSAGMLLTPAPGVP
jgi:hypothetical protein